MHCIQFECIILLINCVNSKYKYKFVWVYQTPITHNCYLSSNPLSILKEKGECNVMYEYKFNNYTIILLYKSHYLFYHIKNVIFVLQTISTSLKLKFRLTQLNKLKVCIYHVYMTARWHMVFVLYGH